MKETALSDAASIRAAKREAGLAIVGNLALAAFKFWVAAVTSSAAVLADSWHTLSDSLSSIVLLVGVRISERPPDKEHPFGHGRAELVASIVIGTMLAGLGAEFLAQAAGKLLHPSVTDYGTLAIAAMAATVVLKEAMARYAFRVGRKTGFASVTADGHHHRGDALSSLVLLVGIAAGRSWPYTDGLLTVVVSGFIFQSAWEVLRAATGKMLGEEPTQELTDALRALGRECLGPASVLHHVHVHHYGSHHEVTFHATLPGTLSLDEAHRAVTELERRILDELAYDATIHIEPYGDTQ